MSERTAIEWCDSTFNPWIGCQKVGPGCDHCYAEQRMDKRLHVVQWGAGQPRDRTSAANWRQPLRWEREHEAFAAANGGRRRRVFCASLADVFDNEVPTDWRDSLFHLIQNTPHLEWLLLTKRIGNAAAMIEATMREQDIGHAVDFAAWPYPNVWIGATITSQAEADRDIPKLFAVPAAKRFLSMEPLLGPVDLWRYLPPHCERHPPPLDADGKCEICEGRGIWSLGDQLDESEKAPIRPGLDWVIVGGESGPHARPMHPDWVRSLRDQCAAAGVPMLFKQWGEWTPGENVERQRGTVDVATWWDDEWKIQPLNLATDHGHVDDQPDLYGVGKKAAGRHLDGVTHDEWPA